jgi:hypothetical protein
MPNPSSPTVHIKGPIHSVHASKASQLSGSGHLCIALELGAATGADAGSADLG